MREALARSDRDFLSSDKMEETPSRFVGALRLVLQRPVEVAGLAAMIGLGLAILVNALALQSGSHASSFLAQQREAREGLASAIPVPPVAPGAAERGSADAATQDATSVLRDVQLALAERGLYDGLADGLFGPKTNTAIRSFQQHNGLAVDGLSSPELLAKITASSAPVLTPGDLVPAAAPAQPADPIAALINGGNTPAAATAPQPDKRVMAVEKVLAKLGYGPLKVDGVVGNDTHNAIAKFERERGLPVSGQITPRLLQELSRVTGTKVE